MLFRLAPTPSGYLHLGNAANLVLTWLAARQRGAQLLLRIDDLDAARKRPEYVDDVFRAIDLLGLDYDLGPVSSADFEANWSQRHRYDHYVSTLNSLREAGALYACGLSRRALKHHSPTYPPEGRMQNLSLEAPDVAWRFRAEGNGTADFVVRRRDGLPAYQIASLTDDHTFGVTHLVRGNDLLASTDRQRQLARSLGWTDFLDAQVFHHPVLLDKWGNKLSKSVGSGGTTPTSVRALRQQGILTDVVFRHVGQLVNAPPDLAGSLDDLRRWGVPDQLFTPIHTVNNLGMVRS